MPDLKNRRLNFKPKHLATTTNILLSVSTSCSATDTRNLFNTLKVLNVKRIIFFGDFHSIVDFLETRREQILNGPQFEYSVLFRPDLVRFLQENIQKADSLLLPRLFCNKDYFKRHSFLAKDVFHFFGINPEVYKIDSAGQVFQISIREPHDVDSVFLVVDTHRSNIYQGVTEITDRLDLTSGTLTVNTQNLSGAKIVVLRRYFFDSDTRFSLFFNYYDATSFAALQKWFKSQLLKLPVPVSGVVYNLQEMFDVAQRFNGVSYSTNLEKVLKGIKKTIAFYYANGSQQTVHNIFLSIVFKRYFNSMLRPRFNILSPNVHYLIRPDSDLAQLLDLNHQFIVNLDVGEFEIATPYYWKTISSLKRAESQLFAETNAVLPVLTHQLLKSPFSIPEQKFHIDLLAQAGATQFWWNAQIEDSYLSKQNLEIIQRKIKYGNQLGAFLSRGLPAGNILMLYPSLDRKQSAFQKILKDLHFSGVNFELINFDLFNSNQYCKIEEGKINFSQKTFTLILLPAIQIIPFLTLKKLTAFFNGGGQIAAIQRIPSQVELRDKQNQFEKNRKDLWMIEPDLQSITFLQNAKGGKSWFIPKLNLLQDFLQPFVQNESIYLQTEQSDILLKIRETRESFFIFLTNPSAKERCRLTVHSRKKAFPFYWDFNKQIQKPMHYWSWHNEHLSIPLTLWPMESRLIILQKELSTDVWHIGLCDADECQVFSPKAGTFIVQLRNPQTGPVHLLLEKGNKSLKVPVHIREKLDPIFLSPDHWILNTDQGKRMIHLDDLPKVMLGLEQSPILQKTFVLRQFRRDQSYYLDLGFAHHPVIIRVNGQTGGKLWHYPLKADVSALLQAGDNVLELEFIGPMPSKNFQAEASYALPDPIRIVPFQKIFIQADEIVDLEK